MTEHLSYSQIEVGKCLLRYDHIYRKKDVVNENEAMRVGKLIHEIIHEYVDRCVKTHIESDYELMKSTVEELFQKSGLDGERLVDVMNICLGFGEKGLDYDHVLDLEKRFEVKVGEAVFTGIIDRTDAGHYEGKPHLKIVDYKSQFKVDTQEDVAKNLQLKLYRYVALKHLYKNFYWVSMGINHLRYGFTRWDAEKPVYVGDLRNEFEGLESFIQQEYKRLKKSDVFPPGRGPWCWDWGGCAVMAENKCPMWELAEVEKMRRAESLAEKVRLLRKLDYERDLILKEVKQNVGDETVEIDGQKVGYEGKETVKYLLFRFIDLAKEYNIEYDGQDSTISKTETWKHIKKADKTQKLPEEFFVNLGNIEEKSYSRSFKY